jgi:hypothetical protein
MYVVVVIPDEMMSVSVVVVGLGDVVKVTIWACIVATRVASKKVLIAIVRINGGIKIMVSCFGWFEVEGLEGLWDGRRWGTYRAVGHGIMRRNSY